MQGAFLALFFNPMHTVTELNVYTHRASVEVGELGVQGTIEEYFIVFTICNASYISLHVQYNVTD